MLKINFKISKKYDLEIINKFIFPGKGDWDWRNYIFFFHPLLKKRLKNIKVKGEKVVESYVNEFYDKNKHILKKRRKEILNNWRKINNIYEKNILKLFGIHKRINFELTCFISICPICPRYLKKNNFSVFYKQTLKEARLTISHEVLHFYYFHKWKSIFPKSNEKTFDWPHIIWHISEILAVVMLNTKELQKILRKKAKSYKEYENIKINKVNVIEFFTKLYNNFNIDKNEFSNFLKEAYREIKKHKKRFMNI